MDTKNLITFRTIVRTGSFLQAATVLGYTPSTITFQIRQLEQELSIQLFEKIGRKMVLTEAGEQILPLVDDVLRACDALSSYGKSLQDVQGSLTVAMPEPLLIYRAQDVLRRFREQVPQVKLFVTICNCNRVREELLTGGIDIGLHYDICPEHPSLRMQKIGAHDACLVAYPQLPESQRDFITPNQVKQVPLINYYTGSVFQEAIAQYLKQKNITIITSMELWSLEAIKRNVMNQLGVAYLPRVSVEEELKTGQLIQLPLDLPSTTVEMVCEHHKNKWISPQMALFLALIDQALLEN